MHEVSEKESFLNLFPFPLDPLLPLPAMEYGSSSGIGMRGRLRMSMAERGVLTVPKKTFFGTSLPTLSGSTSTANSAAATTTASGCTSRPPRSVVTINPVQLTWRHLRPEHVHGDDVDQHDPARRLEQVSLVPHEGHGADALALEATAIGIAALQLAAHVLREEEMRIFVGRILVGPSSTLAVRDI